MTDFLVRRDDLRDTRIADSEKPAPDEGEALLRIDSFGLTSNNITYGVFGEAMSYWDFFPAEDGWGRIPMWGFAEVEESRAEGVQEGTRLFGYLPPSSYLRVVPADAGPAGFVDASPNRRALPSAYHRYLAAGEDPFYRPDTEDVQMLLRPLFFTSFLIDDQLDDEGLLERGPVIISCASSKTALALAQLLAAREDAQLVGLTSPSNVDFVRSLGVHDGVVSYEEIDSLPREPATFVDVAGDARVREQVHRHLGDRLQHSMLVGVTHWEASRGEGGELPGPEPAFFFAPDRVGKRSRDWGRDGLEQRVAGAWHPFCEWIGSWLSVERGHGFEALGAAYLDVVEGRVGPDRAHVIEIQTGEAR